MKRVLRDVLRLELASQHPRHLSGIELHADKIIAASLLGSRDLYDRAREENLRFVSLEPGE